mmetsp:Transcript_23004/g.60667  ORF Transcript_23004/g.60667 Transcript_23004/m.60667 type:complete len:466 (-) Transcript_23004:351-1748(-)
MGCQQSINVEPSTGPFAEVIAVGAAPDASSGRAASPESDHSSFHQEYILAQKLGRGAYATVYAAQRARAVGDDDGHVAVKVLDLRPRATNGVRSNAAGANELRTVKKEILILEGMCNSNVISILDAFIEGNLGYIVMEKCDMTMLQVLDRLPDISELTLMPFFRQMFRGLEAIHKVDVAHRDIKPDNFLCVGDRPESIVVKICDFGLARKLETPWRDALTGVYGTPPFMAPEMLVAKGYGLKVDVWSLGVIMYTLMFGRFPYTGVQSTSASMKAAILAGKPAPSFSQPPTGAGSPASQPSPPLALATGLVRELLNREVSERPTAKQALRCRFFQPQALPELSRACLRSCLNGAKRCGLFDVRPAKVLAAMTDADVQVSALQEKHHGSPASQCEVVSELSTAANTVGASMSCGTNATQQRSLSKVGVGADAACGALGGSGGGTTGTPSGSASARTYLSSLSLDRTV